LITVNCGLTGPQIALHLKREQIRINQSNISENLSAAESRIRDTDLAAETASLTKKQILQQTSQSILNQANQRPKAALSLVG
jgi:flagellin